MKINGEITPPGDKSISHRSFMFGALAQGTTIIRDVLESRDINSTKEAVQSLGAQVGKDGNIWVVTGGSLREPAAVVDAGNSGTTARLVSGICAGINGVTTITGDSSLVLRPMGRVIKPLEEMGARFLARAQRYLPMAIQGGSLMAISYDMEVASAQVKSALLLAGMSAQGTTTVNEPTKSRDHTERMLAYFGAPPVIEGNRISISGNTRLEARDISVPGDPSSAAFPAVWAASTPGSRLLIRNVCINPTRTGFISVLERMGAHISIENILEKAGEPVGDIMIHGETLQATTIQGEEIPKLIDEIPVLVVAACLAQGTTVIRDASELRVKETDRIAAMVKGLCRLGAVIQECDDGMIIEGPARLDSGSIETFSDHRIAMSFYVLAQAFDIDITLDDITCVDISYPNFFSSMESLI
ncbi:MAG TPA: 3-phosphoshikimate 1-carboxyvinyltransferase [Deltaproteobacteria bacterium]|nr:3-phosphoshikimate 1-carboxyvinyltransferase [Deltaproteobacteria bacterium]